MAKKHAIEEKKTGNCALWHIVFARPRKYVVHINISLKINTSTKSCSKISYYLLTGAVPVRYSLPKKETAVHILGAYLVV